MTICCAKKMAYHPLKKFETLEFNQLKSPKISSRDLKFHQNVEPGPPKENTSLVSFK